MNLPVTKSADPRENAPAWAMGLLGLLVLVKVATDGWPVWAVVVTFALFVAFGIATQVFTKRA